MSRRDHGEIHLHGDVTHIVQIFGYGLFCFMRLRVDLPRSYDPLVKRDGLKHHPFCKIDMGDRRIALKFGQLTRMTGYLRFALTPAPLIFERAQIKQALIDLRTRWRKDVASRDAVAEVTH